MAENTTIEWATHTWSPWLGCTKVSPACDHCYAEAWAKRSGIVEWGNHPRRRTSAEYWHRVLVWQRKAEKTGDRPRIFPSLCDPFDNQVPDEWRADFWGLTGRTPNLDWLLLTKRPQNIPKMLPEGWGSGWPNVWPGTTIENRREGERRAWALAQVPAEVRFWSVEPLLEDLGDLTRLCLRDTAADGRPAVSLVIIGGESGPNARLYHYEWAASLIEQCRDAGVACFHKQVGAHPIGFDGRRVHLRDKKGGDPATWPEELRVREMPGAGRK